MATPGSDHPGDGRRLTGDETEASEQRDERGDSGLVGSVIVLVLIAAVCQYVLGVDLVSYFGAAVAWCAGVLEDLFGQRSA